MQQGTQIADHEERIGQEPEVPGAEVERLIRLAQGRKRIRLSLLKRADSAELG